MIGKNIPLQYFFSILDSPLVIERKTQFYKKYEDSNWNLKDLLQQFLHYELEKLMSSCLSIEEFSIELQNSLKTSSRLKELPVISPFGQLTSTSFFYCILTNHTIALRDDMHIMESHGKSWNLLSNYFKVIASLHKCINRMLAYIDF